MLEEVGHSLHLLCGLPRPPPSEQFESCVLEIRLSQVSHPVCWVLAQAFAEV